jgi:hypothetical protein
MENIDATDTATGLESADSSSEVVDLVRETFRWHLNQAKDQACGIARCLSYGRRQEAEEAERLIFALKDSLHNIEALAAREGL